MNGFPNARLTDVDWPDAGSGPENDGGTSRAEESDLGIGSGQLGVYHAS